MAFTAKQDETYNELVRVFDRAGFEVWSPNGHLNKNLSEAAGDILTDDNPAWDRGVKDPLPLKIKIPYTTQDAAQATLTDVKSSLQANGFTLEEELPRLSNGFSQLAQGVFAEKAYDPVKRTEAIVVTISALPDANL